MLQETHIKNKSLIKIYWKMNYVKSYPAVVAQWDYEQQIQVAGLNTHGGSNPAQGKIYMVPQPLILIINSL